MIFGYIESLIGYAVKNGLLDERDVIFAKNRIIDELKLDSFEEEEMSDKTELHEILDGICDYAVQNGIIEDGIVSHDLFDTRIMGILTPLPSKVADDFYSLYNESPVKATDYFYKLCKDCNYIRTDRIKKDLRWSVDSEYGEIDLSVNLSKPEKDPKAIAAAKTAKQVGYPKCMLCRENIGYAGRINFPARQNHRAIPIKINGKPWMLQYSPYVYYNEHCIVFNEEHTPMKIDRDAFAKLLDFVRQFPHYFVGSNADLPIVGGSILSHDHFQGGNFTFPMARAEIEEEVKFEGFPDVTAGIVKWPMSVIRLSSKNTESLINLADRILQNWRKYTDEAAFIYAETEGEPHNTVTPIARKRGENFELDLVLRNNITTEKHPLGVYHPHAELHHIKKENIGLIEVMGLAVLPARLKGEMSKVKEFILAGKDVSSDTDIEKHADWVSKIINKYDSVTEENIDSVIDTEIGIVFTKVLEHAGVYKRTPEGKKAFLKFIESVK